MCFQCVFLFSINFHAPLCTGLTKLTLYRYDRRNCDLYCSELSYSARRCSLFIDASDVLTKGVIIACISLLLFLVLMYAVTAVVCIRLIICLMMCASVTYLGVWVWMGYLYLLNAFIYFVCVLYVLYVYIREQSSYTWLCDICLIYEAWSFKCVCVCNTMVGYFASSCKCWMLISGEQPLIMLLCFVYFVVV